MRNKTKQYYIRDKPMNWITGNLIHTKSKSKLKYNIENVTLSMLQQRKPERWDSLCGWDEMSICCGRCMKGKKKHIDSNDNNWGKNDMMIS